MKSLKIILLVITFPALAYCQIDKVQYDNKKNKYTIEPGKKTDSLFLKQPDFTPIKYNYKKCVFTIKPVGWVSNNLKDILQVNATLINNSDDTLKFVVQTYWERNCWTDNKSLQDDGPTDLIKNFPHTEVIPPHGSKTQAINLYCKKGASNYHGKFKMEFDLLLARGDATIDSISAINADEKTQQKYDNDLRKRRHFIWSNTVEI